jgi:hypothetical protein
MSDQRRCFSLIPSPNHGREFIPLHCLVLVVFLLGFQGFLLVIASLHHRSGVFRAFCADCFTCSMEDYHALCAHVLQIVLYLHFCCIEI